MHHPEVVRIAQQAWDKTKVPTDPLWNECDAHHRQVFIATAQAVVDSGHAVNDFEASVKRLAQEAQEKKDVVAEVQAESPTSHSDEIQLAAARRSGQLDEPKAMAVAASPQVAQAVALPEAPAKPKRQRKPKGEAKASKKSAKKASK